MKPAEIYYKAISVALAEATLSGEAAIHNRRENLAQHPDIMKRVVATAIHHTVHFVGEDRVLNLFEKPYREAGIDVLGHGYSASAFREQGTDVVRKVVRGTEGFSDARRSELAEKLTREISVCQKYLPQYTVPTDVCIAPSPLYGKTTVQLIQPYIAFSTDQLDPREVKQFAEQSLEEMKQTGHLPDVNGINNLVNTEDKGLALIDTVPIVEEEDPRTFGRCALILTEMARLAK